MAAAARCNAWLSGCVAPLVAVARVRWAARRSEGRAPPYTAERISGCRKVRSAARFTSPATSAASPAVGGTPIRAAARQITAGLPEESAAARSNSIWVSAGSARTRRMYRPSRCPFISRWCGNAAAPAIWSAVSSSSKLDEREGVAAGFGGELAGDAGSDRGPAHRGQQHGSVVAREPADGEGVQSVELLGLLGAIAEDQCGSIRVDAASPEREGSQGLPVDPLRVVDDTQQSGAGAGRLRGQADGAEPDQERVGRGALVQTQGRAEGIGLRLWQLGDLVQDGSEQAVQGGVPEGTLGLDAGEPDEQEVLGAPDDVVDERGLPHARLAAERRGSRSNRCAQRRGGRPGRRTRQPDRPGPQSRSYGVTRGRLPLSHVVLIRPPSMTKFAPVTFDVRSEARKTTRVATSSGVVKRPVAKPPMPATIC